MLHSLLCFFMFILLLAIAYIDYTKKIIPNTYNITLFFLGLFWAVAEPGLLSPRERIMGIFIISLPCILLNLLYPGGIGGGDIKMLSAAGFCLGWKSILRGTMTASLLATLIFTALLLQKKITKKDKLPFGPYLCVGMAVELLCI